MKSVWGSSQNIMVVVNNVVQEPDDVAYTIGDDSNDKPKILTFTGTPANGDSIYVIHHGLTSIHHSPARGSVGANELSDALKNIYYRHIYW